MARKDEYLLDVAGMLNRNEIPKRDYDSRISGLRQEIAAVEAKLRGVQKRIRRRTAGRKETERATAMLKGFNKLWDDLSTEEKADLLSFVIEYLSFEAQGTFVRVHLKLILCNEQPARLEQASERW